MTIKASSKLTREEYEHPRTKHQAREARIQGQPVLQESRPHECPQQQARLQERQYSSDESDEPFASTSQDAYIPRIHAYKRQRTTQCVDEVCSNTVLNDPIGFSAALSFLGAGEDPIPEIGSKKN